MVIVGICASGCEDCDAIAVGDGSRFQCVKGFLASVVVKRRRSVRREERRSFIVGMMLDVWCSEGGFVIVYG